MEMATSKETASQYEPPLAYVYDQSSEGHPGSGGYPEGGGYPKGGEFPKVRGYPDSSPLGHREGQYDPSATNVVTIQPGVALLEPIGPPPNDYLCFAAITCGCCFWPLAVPAVVLAGQSRKHAAAGDYKRARLKGLASLGLSIAALFAGVTTITLIVLHHVSSW